MRTPVLRVLAYPRVSGREQGSRGTSLPAQRERFAAYCTMRGLPAPIWYEEIESGTEAKRAQRVQFDRLLAEARPGDLVLVTDVSRFTRDVVDGVGSARDLVRRGIGLIAIDDGIDASTPEGMRRLEDQALGAQREGENIKRRTVGARMRLRDQGHVAEGPASFGYRRGARAERRQLELDVHVEEAALVVQLARRSIAGASLRDLAEWLGVELGRTVGENVVHTILRNRLYLGEVRDSRGVWIVGRHKAILDRETWERVQAGLKARAKGGRRPTGEARTATWLLRGLACCPECGARCGAAYGAGGRDYYICAGRRRRGGCESGYVRVDVADPRADALALERLVELREELGRASAPSAPPKARDFDRERARIAGQLARAERGWVDGLLDDDGLRRARGRLDEELGRVEVATAAAARAERAGDPLVRRRALRDVARLSAAWVAAPVATRRTAIGVLARTIRLHPDQVAIEWRTAEELCAATGTANWFAGTDDAPPILGTKPGRR